MHRRPVPQNLLKLPFWAIWKLCVLLKQAQSHRWKAPSDQALALQAAGCDQQIVLKFFWPLACAFFFKHRFLTWILVKCVHRARKAKTNKPQVFELRAEPGVASADAFSDEREGHAVNIGLTLGWNAAERCPAQRQRGRLDRIEEPWAVTSVFHWECGL